MTRNLGGSIQQIAVCGAIGGFVWFFSPDVAIAQIAGDGTVGTVVNGSLAVSCDGVCRIQGGTTRGVNLFHSLREFSVPTGGAAWFDNGPQVQNILTRVTGNTVSNINGLIKANGSANLFLLNPNGILFGRNARLNVGGSFSATTADAIEFGNQGNFGLTSFDNTLPLLTVKPSAYLFNQPSRGNITNQSRANNLLGLQVPDGQSLMLLGGNVALEGGRLATGGGRVELGAVAGIGRVEILPTGAVRFAPGLARGKVALTAGARVDVRLRGGGEISLTAGEIRLAEGSLLLAGIDTAGGSAMSRAGDVELDATGTIRVEDSSQILNMVNPNMIGNAGDIRIKGKNLKVTEENLKITEENLGKISNRAGLYSDSFGTGNAGNILIWVDESVLFRNSNAYSDIRGIGQAGNIEISARTLEVSDLARLSSRSFGTGNAGNILIQARGGSVRFQDSVAFSTIWGVGRGGNIEISTGTLELLDGAELRALSRGKGDGGNVVIQASDRVVLDGVSQRNFASLIGGSSSGIFTSNTSFDAVGDGKGGNISITAPSLSVRNGAVIDARTSNSLPGGNITLDLGHLTLLSGGQIFTISEGSGAAGTITLNAADSVLISGSDPTYSNRLVLERSKKVNVIVNPISANSALYVRSTGTGSAGDIRLTTPILTVTGDAQIAADTLNKGKGGSILINALTAVNLIRTQDFSPVLSVETRGAGQAGNIEINTPTLTLTDKAQITATSTAKATNREGGGSITLNASNLYLAGIVGVFAETQGKSPAGTLKLNPYQNQPNLDITLTQNSKISASTSGSGNGGDLILTAPQSITIAGPGTLAVETSSTGKAGNIQVTTEQLTLKDGVTLSASTTKGSTGQGGNIFLDPKILTVQNGAKIAVDSQGDGIGGSIFVDKGRLDRLVLRDEGLITAKTARAQGGNITLKVNDLLLLRRLSGISATAGTDQGTGKGGNIAITSKFIVAVPKENSDITANASKGRGGEVRIQAKNLFGIQARLKPTPLSDITASSDSGPTGTVNITPPDVDPNRGLVPLPVALTDPSNKIDQQCAAGTNVGSSQFVVVGHSGLPASPENSINPSSTIARLATIQSTPAIEHPQVKAAIVEAQTVIRQTNGQIRFVAFSPTNPAISHLSQPNCQHRFSRPE